MCFARTSQRNKANATSFAAQKPPPQFAFARFHVTYVQPAMAGSADDNRSFFHWSMQKKIQNVNDASPDVMVKMAEKNEILWCKTGFSLMATTILFFPHSTGLRHTHTHSRMEYKCHSLFAQTLRSTLHRKCSMH